MDHGAHGGLVDPEAERDSAYEHTDFIRHPAFLIARPLVAVHFPVIGDAASMPFCARKATVSPTRAMVGA